MKITIITADANVLKTLKSVKLPFVKKHPLFRLLTETFEAYNKKQPGQKIRAKSENPKIEIIFEDSPEGC